MKQKVAVERYATTSDGMGGTTTVYNKIADVWCNIKPLSGHKRLEFGKLDSTVTHEITMRYRENISDQDRVKYNGRIFTLKFQINEGEENSFITFGASSED